MKTKSININFCIIFRKNTFYCEAELAVVFEAIIVKLYSKATFHGGISLRKALVVIST